MCVCSLFLRLLVSLQPTLAFCWHYRERSITRVVQQPRQKLDVRCGGVGSCSYCGSFVVQHAWRCCCLALSRALCCLADAPAGGCLPAERNRERIQIQIAEVTRAALSSHNVAPCDPASQRARSHRLLSSLVLLGSHPLSCQSGSNFDSSYY